MELIRDESLFWPEMQTHTSEEFKKKAHIWKEELRLFEKEIRDDPELVIPKGSKHCMMLILRMCRYNHEAALHCLRRHLHQRKAVVDIKEWGEVFWPEIWATPANEMEERITYIKKEFCLLKEKLAEEKGLVLPLDDDELLLRFFRARKYDHKRTVLLIRNYFRNRAESRDLYQGYLPSAMLHYINLNLLIIHRYADAMGRFICTAKFEEWNPAGVKLEDACRFFLLPFETVSFFPLVQLHGVVIVVDMRGFRFGNLKYLTPFFFKRVLLAVQNCIPLKIKEVHVLFQSLVFDIAYAVVKPFLTQKLRSRLHFHGSNMESLHRYVSPELLHSDYGGTLGSFNCDGIPESILHFEPAFRHINKFGYKRRTGHEN